MESTYTPEFSREELLCIYESLKDSIGGPSETCRSRRLALNLAQSIEWMLHGRCLKCGRPGCDQSKEVER